MNPNQFINQILNSPMKNNPMFSNAYQLMQKNDVNGLKQMASNLCKEKGLDVNQIESQIRQKFRF